jgi:hypothetical protein
MFITCIYKEKNVIREKQIHHNAMHLYREMADFFICALLSESSPPMLIAINAIRASSNKNNQLNTKKINVRYLC